MELMRIEVIVGNDEPLIFPLNKPKVLIGSMDSCDIVLKSSSVSRKHLLVITAGDKFFVVDQGSTNGSFINEERLVPGQNTEFNSFFPVRLGADILITLLPDEEAVGLGMESSLNQFMDASVKKSDVHEEEKTRVISLTKLEKSSTAELVNKRNENLPKRRTATEAKSKTQKTSGARSKFNSNQKMGVFLALGLVAVAYYQFKLKPKENVNVASSPVEQTKVVEVKKKPIQRIDMALLPDPQKILPLVKGPKCSSDEEKYFCASIPSIFMLWFGTIKLDKNIVIVAEGQSYLQRAHKYLGDVKKGHPNYQNDLFLAALNLWVKDNVPDTLKSLENTKDYFFTLFFVTDNKDEPAYLGGAAFVPDSLLRLKQDLSEQNFKAAEKNGAVEFSFALDYFRLL